MKRRAVVPGAHDSNSAARASAVTVETQLVLDLLVNYVYLMFSLYL